VKSCKEAIRRELMEEEMNSEELEVIDTEIMISQ
jgi:hypothetical protein